MVKTDDIHFEVSQFCNKESLPEDSWKVRPCEWYNEEYKDCKNSSGPQKGVRARLHQYFVYGETIDCIQWKKDYDDCLIFRNKEDIKHLENVIKSENRRYQERKKTIIENDTWEYRDKCPKNWNSPMPEWMIEKKKSSLLVKTQDLLNEGIAPSPVFTGISCTLM